MRQNQYLVVIFAFLSPICGAYHLIDGTLPETLGFTDRRLAQSYKRGLSEESPIHFSISKGSQKDSKKNGKGSSASGKATSKSSKKSSKKSKKSSSNTSSSSPIESDSSDSGKGSSASGKATSKSSKKSSKKSKKSSSNTSSSSPVESDSSDSGDSRPPTPVEEPTRQPSSGCFSAVLLSAYSIEYTLDIDNGEMPSQTEYRDLSIVVDRIISEYMGSQYSTSTSVFVTDFETLTGNTEFRSPTLIADYDSQACFSSDSDRPSKATLDNLLVNMLSTQQDRDAFITTARSLLPSGNIFKTSLIDVEFGESPAIRSISASSTGNGTTIASGLAGIFLLAAGMITYKKRRSEDEFCNQKGYGKDDDGDTFTGEAYMASETCSKNIGSETNSAPSICSETDFQRRVSHGIRASTSTPNTLQWSPLSKGEWNKGLVGGKSETLNYDHIMKELDSFLEDDRILDSGSKAGDFSIYRDELNAASKKIEDISLSDLSEVDHKPYSVDQIESMLSYPL